MKDLTLNNGETAKFCYIDGWRRPVYDVHGVKVCCVNLDGTFLHTMTDDGEPLSPLKQEFQPIQEAE